MSTNSTLPKILQNMGTWTEVDADRFLKAVGASGTVGNAAAIKTSSEEAPTVAHMHSFTPKGSISATNPTISNGAHPTASGIGPTSYVAVAAGASNSLVWNSSTTPSLSGGTYTFKGTQDNTGSTGKTSGTAAAKHSHDPGAPTSYGLHIWVRTA